MVGGVPCLGCRCTAMGRDAVADMAVSPCSHHGPHADAPQSCRRAEGLDLTRAFERCRAGRRNDPVRLCRAAEHGTFHGEPYGVCINDRATHTYTLAWTSRNVRPG